MSQRTKVNKTRRRRPLTYVWIFGLALVVALLIYFERTEMLYILATLGVTALLVIVGTSDLGQNERSELIDAQAAGSGISSTAPPTAKK
jgi:amino acid permease